MNVHVFPYYSWGPQRQSGPRRRLTDQSRRQNGLEHRLTDQPWRHSGLKCRLTDQPLKAEWSEAHADGSHCLTTLVSKYHLGRSRCETVYQLANMAFLLVPYSSVLHHSITDDLSISKKFLTRVSIQIDSITHDTCPSFLYFFKKILSFWVLTKLLIHNYIWH